MQNSVHNDVNEDDLNRILKDLYDTNFFKNVSINLDQDVLNISVEENPLIENIEYNGIKSKTLLNEITKNLSLKARSSYSDILFRNDKNKIISKLKNTGYYFSNIELEKIDLANNKVDLIFNIDIGDKAKIKKISFVGNKIYKDSKLRGLIVSEDISFGNLYQEKSI